MRRIKAAELAETVGRLFIEANICLPPDVEAAIERAAGAETGELPKEILNMLRSNAKIAREEKLPICQDTGMAVVFIDWGQEAVLEGGDFERAVSDGVAAGCEAGYLRASVVNDPLRRKNTGDNTPPVIHLRFVPGDRVSVTVAPKGFGSENMSALAMLNPGSAAEEIIDWVVAKVRLAGANPCPPVVVGVGLGGTAELCCENAKRALLREIGSVHEDDFYAELESRTLAAVNALGIGPQGMGGKTTALAVFYKASPTHIAGLPVAVNIGCHALRHATAVL